ncbi:MAG: hypothetical protein LBU78_14870 [Microbacterium sp.]|nr:hypothetical protein [Microbacterium sp.]
MIDITAADMSAQQDVWAWAVASGALEEALNALMDAQSVVEELTVSTNWRVKAGQLLHGEMLERRSQIVALNATVHDLQWRLERAVA